jgi:Flp pilus assembly protein CpaB
MARTMVDKTRGNGAVPLSDTPRLEPPARQRRRLPELMIGIIVMVVFALGAVLWHSSTTEREAVLALVGDIERGETIAGADLRAVYVASDDPIAHVRQEESGDIVGRIATTDLEAGTLVTRSQVADRVTIGAGEGVVGLALDPGQFPALGLLPGDRVNVVSAEPVAPEDGEDPPSPVLARGGEVFAVEDLGGQGRQFVSLRMSEDDANRVAAAAERGPVRLVLVGS